MKKINWQYLIDVLLFVSIAAVVTIGFLLAFVIPKGPSASDNAKYFLDLHRHEWGDIHLYLGIVFTGLVLLHLVLGWKWIKGTTRALFRNQWKPALLVGCLLPVAVLAVSWSLFPDRADLHQQSAKDRGLLLRGVLQPGTPPPYNASNTIPAASAHVEHNDEAPALTRGRSSEETSGVLITGQMTFGDIERQTGVSALELSERLGIPRDASLGDSLGKMRKKYGFSMQQVREVTATLVEQRNPM